MISNDDIAVMVDRIDSLLNEAGITNGLDRAGIMGAAFAWECTRLDANTRRAVIIAHLAALQMALVDNGDDTEHPEHERTTH